MVEMEIVFAVCILILTCIWYGIPFIKNYLDNRKICLLVDRLPGDRKFPIVGTTLQMLLLGRKNFWKFSQQRHTKYGPIFRSWVGSIPVVNIYKAEHIEAVLKTNTHMKRGPLLKRIMGPLVGEGMMFATGDRWKTHRRNITPAFYPNMLDKYSEVFAEKADILTKMLENAGEDYFDIRPYLKMAINDTSCETLMGISSNSLITKNCEYGTALEEFSEITIRRMYNPIYSNNFVYSFTKLASRCKVLLRGFSEYTQKAISTRQAESYQTKEKENATLLDVLLANRQNSIFTEQDLIDEANTFMIGSQDNISFAIGWTLFCLSNHLDVQEKVHDELDNILGKSEGPLNIQQIAQMQYMDRVIKETMRLYPTIPKSQRMLEEDIILDRYKIPKGVIIMWSIWDLHHDPTNFPEPFKFDPDRFLPEEIAKRDPSSYIPFGIGPRNCMGTKFSLRTIKFMLASILRKFEVRCLETQETMECFAEIVLRPQNGLHIKLKARS